MKLYIRAKYREGIRFERKLQSFAWVIAIGFAVIVLRLMYLQLIAGGEFKQLSDQNRIRLLPLKAPRGLVYDRAGALLIDNRPSFTVSIIPAESSDPPEILSKVAQFLDYDREAVIEEINASRFTPFKQIVIAQDVSIEEAAAIEEYSLELPGVVITAEPRRRFPLGNSGAQVFGYPGQISASELERLSEDGYQMGDAIGKAGIELVAEHWLRGFDGGMQVQVYADARPQLELDPSGNPSVRIDTAGHRLLTLGKKPPLAGNTVVLNIDAQLQRIALEEMGEQNGVVVILDAETGAVRAMVSKPTYDPNVFVSAGADAERIEVLKNPGHPLLNRAIQAYPPGSTFKVIMAYAALTEGVVNPETRFKCTGSFRLGRRFRCWKDWGHGEVNLVEALAYSCDVFFYNVGVELGIERISKYSELFGLGEPTGIELDGEMRGIVPSPEWKKRNFRTAANRKWYKGETVNASIGQGYMLVTPLQLATAYAALVNGGKLMRPYLIERVSTPDNEEVLMFNQPWGKGVLENTKALELIQEGLREAINSREPFYGTGWRAKNKTVALMGKTGTAQVVAFKERAETKEQLEKVPYKHRDHAWFVAITEDAEEKLVILALCEHGGHASESAVPVVREIAKRIVEISANDAAPEGESG
jgi:penicillin-binding protein 2